MVDEYRKNILTKIQSFNSNNGTDSGKSTDSNVKTAWKFVRSAECQITEPLECRLCESDVLGPYFIYIKQITESGKDIGKELRCCRSCVHHLEVKFPVEILDVMLKGMEICFRGFQHSTTGKRKMLFGVTEKFIIEYFESNKSIKKWVPLYKHDTESGPDFELAVLPPFDYKRTSEEYTAEKCFEIDKKYIVKLCLREWYIYGGGYTIYVME